MDANNAINLINETFHNKFNLLLYFYYTMWRIATQLVYTFLRDFDNKKTPDYTINIIRCP